MKRLLSFILLFAASLSVAFTQVTTSGISGRITGGAQETLPGATVVAVHKPSGTQYAAISNAEGYYSIQGMRPGGPYEVNISFIGYRAESYSDITLLLGQVFVLNVTLRDDAVDLGEIVVVGYKNSAFSTQKTGASTNVSSEEINSLPTINRSLNDFTRLTPQAGAGSSFAGRDGRYNNITIDGANFNNNFGLSSRNLPGGDAQPISLDAIQEISVNIAPFDVRQSNFTGANVNAITRSGDNQYKGSVYTYYRDKSFNGDKVGDAELDLEKTTTKTYGGRVGGPIIENKLFFFVNGEIESSSFPGINWRPSDPANGINANPDAYISRATVADLERMKNHLINQHGYNPGDYQGFGNFNSDNHKFLARVDWNIDYNHRLTLRYNTVRSENDQGINATSAPNPRSSFGRVSEKSMAYSNAFYGLLNTVHSFTGELNSVLGSNLSNKMLVTYTKIRDTRSSGSDIFPFVDIYQDGDPYMSFGYELFSFDNDVKNNVFTFTNNLSYYLGKHTLTAGVSFDRLYFGNSYKRYGTSYYRFASMDAFINGALPTVFGLTYPYEGAGDGYAELNFGLGSVYLQDEFQVNDRLRLTGGIRFDRPFFFDDLLPNPAIEALTFQDLNGSPEKLDVGSWPDAKVLFSPRFGFNWDVDSEQTIKVRGGSGIFTGRLPFVWFTNQPTNSGVLQNTVEISSAATISDMNLGFSADPFAHVNKFAQQPANVAPGSIALVSKDFRMPQVWRNNLAADFKLPQNTVLTIEGIYTKDINAIIQRNANSTPASGGTLAGPDNRPLYAAGDRRINSGVASAIVLDNVSKGHSYSLTTQISRGFSNGFFGSLAYTYAMAKDFTANPGSTAVSVWSVNPTVDGANYPDLSYSSFNIPHRVVGAISYKAEYSRNLATTFSLYYQGSNQGRLNYIYSNDINNDGYSFDLMYIPKDDTEIRFVDIVSGGNVVHTAAAQRQAFWNYVDQDKYLSANKGKYAERFGVLMPWNHRFDFKVLQDVIVNAGNRKHTLQVSFDLLNAGNFLNSDWGVLKRQVTGNFENIPLLQYAGNDAEGIPTFRMNQVGGQLPTQSFVDVLSTASTWSAQIGLRYIF